MIPARDVPVCMCLPLCERVRVWRDLPVKPCRPIGPTLPMSPLEPLTPCTPWRPVKPVGPRTPVAPVAPLGPWKPLGPAGPLGPTIPEILHLHVILGGYFCNLYPGCTFGLQVIRGYVSLKPVFL